MLNVTNNFDVEDEMPKNFEEMPDFNNKKDTITHNNPS